jgi:hypothetical protein
MALDTNITFSNLQALNEEFSEVQAQASAGANEYTELEVILTDTDIATLGSGFELLPSLGSTQYYDIESVIFESIKVSTNFTTTAENLDIKYGSSIIGNVPKLVITSSSISNVVAKAAFLNVTVLDTTATVTLSTDDASTPAGGDYLLRVLIRYKAVDFYVAAPK